MIIVGLVGTKDDGNAVVTAQDGRHGLVKVGDTILCIYKKQDEVGLFSGHKYLLADFLLEDVIRINHPTSCIYDRKLTSAPFTLPVLAVARSASFFADDGRTCPCEAIKERGLTHIGASDDGD